jgi:hypothetical protein
MCTNDTKKLELDLQLAELNLRWRQYVEAAEILHAEEAT